MTLQVHYEITIEMRSFLVITLSKKLPDWTRNINEAYCTLHTHHYGPLILHFF